MILIHINLRFYPTNWYVLIHVNSCHKKEIESWRYLSPSWLSHYPLVVPPSCPAPSIAVALAVTPSIACRRLALRRCRAAAAAAASTLLPCCRRCAVRRRRPAVAAAASTLLPPRCRCPAVRRRHAAVAVTPPPSCGCCRCSCRSAVCWLVVVLLSAVRFRHCMLSCNRRRSHCWHEHFCTNWYVLIWTTSILAINIDSTCTNCTNLYK
jgi:hypothetical protein